MNEQLESWKIALDLAVRDYEHTVITWPSTLREKGLAYVQLYTVTAGVLPIYLVAVYRYVLRFGTIGFSGNFTCGSLIFCLSAATVLLFMASCYYIRNVIRLKVRATFDSSGVVDLLEHKTVIPEQLCQETAQRLGEYIKENTNLASELSKEIQRSYRYYFLSLIAGLGIYIYCILS